MAASPPRDAGPHTGTLQPLDPSPLQTPHPAHDTVTRDIVAPTRDTPTYARAYTRGRRPSPSFPPNPPNYPYP